MNITKIGVPLVALLFIGYSGYSQSTERVIYKSDAYTVFSDRVIQGNYTAKALSATEMASNYPANNKPENTIMPQWKLSKDISAFPRYHSDNVLVDALYNLALQEMEKAIEPDSTFRTGARWSGVWTRDISYSIILSMAVLQPEVAKKSLLCKAKNDRIIQDTGTGGSYPVSTDRMIWAVAAWEIYKVTRDIAWLKRVYPIIKNSIEDDEHNIYDNATGLVRGESSFLDWREQTYPKWMQPADIFTAEALGTNAVHYQANNVLAQMAAILHDKKAAQKYTLKSAGIKAGINKYLWLADKGYYAQFLYGRNYLISSPKSESLGEALCVLFDIADEKQQKAIVEHTPSMAFGIPCVYPQIPDMFNYHNNAVWPFVQSYWVLAAAKAGNSTAVIRGLSAIYRPAAFFLTNKENFVASTGDYSGTRVNSSNMLWSLSGNISMVYKVLFGMRFNESNLTFHPFVPASLGGKQTLTNFKYRHALLDIELMGSGNKISAVTLDGKLISQAEIPAALSGKHQLKIKLADNVIKSVSPKIYEPRETLKTPVLSNRAGTLSWHPVPGAKEYRVLMNGKELLKTNDTIVNAKVNSEYQVIAVDQDRYQSFASEPLSIIAPAAEQHYEMENFAAPSNLPYQGFSGKGFVEINKQQNLTIQIPVEIKTPGTYAISFRYANGNGYFYNNNKCAIRTLKKDGISLGTFVFPQRGLDKWSEWGNSNSISVKLDKGRQLLSLVFDPQDENMNGDVNQAMLDYLRIIWVK